MWFWLGHVCDNCKTLLLQSQLLVFHLPGVMHVCWSSAVLYIKPSLLDSEISHVHNLLLLGWTGRAAVCWLPQCSLSEEFPLSGGTSAPARTGASLKHDMNNYFVFDFVCSLCREITYRNWISLHKYIGFQYRSIWQKITFFYIPTWGARHSCVWYSPLCITTHLRRKGTLFPDAVFPCVIWWLVIVADLYL